MLWLDIGLYVFHFVDQPQCEIFIFILFFLLTREMRILQIRYRYHRMQSRGVCLQVR